MKKISRKAKRSIAEESRRGSGYLFSHETRRKMALEAIIKENYAELSKRYHGVSYSTVKRYIKQFREEPFFIEILFRK